MPAIRIHADAAGHADFAALQFVPVVIHVIGVQRGLGLQAGSGYPDQCRQPECCESCGTHHRTTSRGPYLLTERSVARQPETGPPHRRGSSPFPSGTNRNGGGGGWEEKRLATCSEWYKTNSFAPFRRAALRCGTSFTPNYRAQAIGKRGVQAVFSTVSRGFDGESENFTGR